LKRRMRARRKASVSFLDWFGILDIIFCSRWYELYWYKIACFLRREALRDGSNLMIVDSFLLRSIVERNEHEVARYYTANGFLMGRRGR